MIFQIEDTEVSTSSIDMLGHGEWIRLRHKPSEISIEYRSKNGAIRRAVKDRLLAQLKVLVGNYEQTKPS